MSLNEKLDQNAMDVLKKYSVNPPGVSDYRDRPVITMSDEPPKMIKKQVGITVETDVQTYTGVNWDKWKFPTDKVTGLTHITHRIVKTNQRIVYVDLKKNTGQPYMLDMTIWLHREEQDMVPIYYLPWDSGVAMQINIPSNQSLTNAGVDITDTENHPKLFFTAGLSGCSITFGGIAQAPTVYHCGLQNSNVKAPLDERFWERVLGNTVGGNLSTMHKGYYKGDDIEKILTQKLMESQHMIKICQVMPWGTVFGIRTNDQWAFYLQQNTIIQYQTWKKVTRKTGFLKLGRTTDFVLETTSKYVRVPMYIAKIFPGGSGSVVLETKARVID